MPTRSSLSRNAVCNTASVAVAVLCVSLLVSFVQSQVICESRPITDVVPVCHENSAFPSVGGRWIVTICPTSDLSMAIADITVQCGIQPLSIFGGHHRASKTAIHKGFVMLSENDDEITCVAKHSQTVGIECDRIATGAGLTTQSGSTWGLDRIDQHTGSNGDYTYNYTGSGINVYILSAGINRLHSDFGGRADNFYSSFLGSSDPDLANFDLDCNGHGTAVAGIVGGTTYGVAKAASIHGLKVFNCSLQALVSDILNGLDYIHSFGTSPGVIVAPFATGLATALDEAIAESSYLGYVVVTAAGNLGGDSCKYSPGRTMKTSPIINVGASTSTDAVWSSSNVGSCVSLFAPGENVVTLDHTNLSGGTVTRSGTSYAAGFAAGVAALYLEQVVLTAPTPAEMIAVRDAIVGAATTGVLSSVPSATQNRLLYSFPAALGSITLPFDNPCTTCEHWHLEITSLSSIYLPDENGYVVQTDGIHTGWIYGDLGSLDMDVYFSMQDGSGHWIDVIRAGSHWTNDVLSQAVIPGTRYRWVAFAFDGNGFFDFYLDRGCDQLSNCSFPSGVCSAPNQCTCYYGYSGSSCATTLCYGKVDGGDPDACSGHGSCVGVDTCNCLPAYYGDECENYCTPAVNCSGHGTCSPVDGSCVCATNYTGSRCEQLVCTPACENNGTCVRRSGENVCSCRPGYSGPTCGVTNGTGFHDPHFVGFQGQHFDFQGIAGQTYAMISDEHFAMNARFVGYKPTVRRRSQDYQTYMSEFGFLVGDDQVFVGCDRTVRINGHRLGREKTFTLMNGGTVSMRTYMLGLNVPHYTITVMFRKHPDLPNGCFLNFNTEYKESKDRVAKPHGILGQTAVLRVDPLNGDVIRDGRGFMAERKQGGRVIEGHYSEYRIVNDDLFSTDFKYSQFKNVNIEMETFSRTKILNTLSSRGTSELSEPIPADN